MPPPTKGVCLVRLLSGVVIERTVADRPVRRLLVPRWRGGHGVADAGADAADVQQAQPAQRGPPADVRAVTPRHAWSIKLAPAPAPGSTWLPQVAPPSCVTRMVSGLAMT
jgi:hypothetical protein